MRLYGFDYQKARSLDPKIAVENFLRFCLRVDSAFIAPHAFEVQWVIKSSVAKSYFPLTFPSNRKGKAVEERRRKIDISYRPHGRPITIREDYAPEEDGYVEKAKKYAKSCAAEMWSFFKGTFKFELEIRPI